MSYEVVENESIECLSPKDVMKLLGVSRAIAYRIFNSDGFPCFKLGDKCLRVTKKDFNDWIQSKKEN